MRGLQRREPVGRHRPGHPARAVGEVRPLVRRTRSEHVARVGERRAGEALHPRLVEIVGDQPPLAMEIAVAALVGVRRRRGEARRVGQGSVEGARVAGDHREVVGDRLHRDAIRPVELAAERAHRIRPLRVPDDPPVARRDQERRHGGREPVAEPDGGRTGSAPRRAVRLERAARLRGPARDQRRRLGLERARHEEPRPRDRPVRGHDGERPERFVTQLAEPSDRAGERAEGGGIGPRGTLRGRSERLALVVRPFEPPGGGVDRGGRHLAAHRHAIAVREQVGGELGVGEGRVEVALVERPRAAVQELHVGPDGEGVADQRDVASAWREPRRRAPRERRAARPVEREGGVEERQVRRRPARALREQRREPGRHSFGGQVLDRNEEQPGVVEVVAGEDHSPATGSPGRSSARSSTPWGCRRRVAGRRSG
jgi:hypothetical protein